MLLTFSQRLQENHFVKQLQLLFRVGLILSGMCVVSNLQERTLVFFLQALSKTEQGLRRKVSGVSADGWHPNDFDIVFNNRRDPFTLHSLLTQKGIHPCAVCSSFRQWPCSTCQPLDCATDLQSRHGPWRFFPDAIHRQTHLTFKIEPYMLWQEADKLGWMTVPKCSSQTHLSCTCRAGASCQTTSCLVHNVGLCRSVSSMTPTGPSEKSQPFSFMYPSLSLLHTCKHVYKPCNFCWWLFQQQWTMTAPCSRWLPPFRGLRERRLFVCVSFLLEQEISGDI